MLLPERTCPYCHRSSATVPISHHAYDLQACGVCKGRFVPLPDGTAAIPLPPLISVTATRELFEVAIDGWFVTFGAADRALRFRVEPTRVAWSRYPSLGHIRFDEGWDTVARGAVRRFDWRMIERGTRGLNDNEVWMAIVLVGQDDSDSTIPHRFGLSFEHGSALTTLLEWALDVVVTAPGEGGSAYRGMQARAPRAPLSVVRENGQLQRLLV